MDTFRRRFALISFVAFKASFLVAWSFVSIAYVQQFPGCERSEITSRTCKIVLSRLMQRLPIALSDNMGL
jgi:hypothetical protein